MEKKIDRAVASAALAATLPAHTCVDRPHLPCDACGPTIQARQRPPERSRWRLEQRFERKIQESGTPDADCTAGAYEHPAQRCVLQF
jgi:hypothetical protein